MNEEVPEIGNHLTIQMFLKSLGFSQGLISHLKATPNGILKNDVWAYTRDVLELDDVLKITLTENHSSEQILPVNLPLDIVYEDQDLMVINKPANMPVHPSQGNHENTLANGVAWYYQRQNLPFVYRCINRLDRDTSGLLILAKHGYSAALLSQMIEKREIHREYLAIACGKVPSEGTIIAPISRVSGSTIEREVNEETGDYACTHYKRISYSNKIPLPASNEGCSLVALTLETGRTHQIRVHMKHIGHPLPGDFLYHPDYSLISRQALHSHKLSFCHPITGESLIFQSPLPPDMGKYFS